MRKLVLTWCIGVVLTQAAAAQQPVPAEPWANKIFGTVTSKDFGAVAKGAQLKYAFKMTNIYKVPLEITNIRVTCGCVTATPSTKVLQPNETGYLNITMDTNRRPIPANGHKKIEIYVTVGPQFISTAMLKVEATIRQDVILNPGEIDFGVVHRGAAPMKFLDVEYAGTGNWRLDEIVKNANAPFSLEVKELPARAGAFGAKQVGYRIHATVKADAAPGQFKEEILLKTNDPASPVLTFSITGNVQAALTAVPAVVAMNGVRAGAIFEQKVVVHGSRPFKIVRIDGQGQGITAVSASDRMAPIHFLTIRCQPDQAGEIRRTLVIVSSLENESVQIMVEAKP